MESPLLLGSLCSSGRMAVSSYGEDGEGGEGGEDGEDGEAEPLKSPRIGGCEGASSAKLSYVSDIHPSFVTSGKEQRFL